MKSLIAAAVTLVILVLLGLHFDDQLPTHYATVSVSALTHYYTASPYAAAFHHISSGSWFHTKTTTDVKTDGWPPDLQCSLIPESLAITNATDTTTNSPPALDQLFCAKCTSSNSFNTALVKIDMYRRYQHNPPKDDLLLAASAPQIQCDLDHQLHSTTNKLSPHHNTTTYNNNAFHDLDGLLYRLDSEADHGETDQCKRKNHNAHNDGDRSNHNNSDTIDNSNMTPNAPNQHTHQHPIKDTPLANWFEILNYLRTLDQETPVTPWLEYLELVALLAFTIHFGFHLRDYADLDFDGRSYWEQYSRLHQHTTSALRPVLLRLENDDKADGKNKHKRIQPTVTTIKIASASASASRSRSTSTSRSALTSRGQSFHESRWRQHQVLARTTSCPLPLQ